MQLLQFAAVKQNDDGTIEYLMRWKDGFKESVINSNEMKQKWPFLLMEFLETRLHIFIPANPTLNVIDFPLSAGNATGNPKEVHCKFMHLSLKQLSSCHIYLISIYSFLHVDVSDFGFEINYWVEFQNGMCKFVKSDEMKTNWPLLAAVYLEEHLSFN